MNIRDYIGKQRLILDGGMGSMLIARGLQPGEVPERWNIEHPEAVQQVHLEYFRAGANIVETDSGAINALVFPDEGTYSVENLARAAVENAAAARRIADAEDGGALPRFIAFSVMPLGRLMEPAGDLTFEEAYAVYARTARAAEAAGADAILFETMTDLYEIKAAVTAAKANCALPVFASMTFSENGRLMSGGDVLAELALLEGLHVDVIGMNCGLGPVQVKPLALKMLEFSSTPLMIYPNAGLPEIIDGHSVYNVIPEEFAAVMADIAAAGVWITGGCCGTTPAHIRAMAERCRDLPCEPVSEKRCCLISGANTSVVIGKDPIIIGERINPTGKKKFKEALRNHDIEYIVREGLTQQENGAHALDVNVGLPEIDETRMMTDVVKSLQKVIGLPLQLDTSNPETMEQALRIYNGKALINSVNGKEEVMRSIFPLVKKYGGAVIALTLDENGIPATADARFAIAEKIYRTAAEYGIPKRDILIDSLAMTISSDQTSALTALETVRRIKQELHGYTVLGVSNISFGLPQREIINAAFYTLALQSGLDAAIINPNAEAMMRAYYAYRALVGLDTQCLFYIDRYSQIPTETLVAPKVTAKQSVTVAASLGECIERGLKESAAEIATALLESCPPLDVINRELIPALDAVGKSLAEGKTFLPQLLLSAESAGAAFDVIKKYLQQSGIQRDKKAVVVLATVKGDIHDIGKNIVKVLLENYDYEVIDLGKNVEAQAIADAVKEHNARLVGLSALMTTTAPAMAEVIKLLREQAPECKVMIGGAALTQTYSDQIGADCYCRDAMAGVNYAESLL